MHYNTASVIPTGNYQGTQYYYFAVEKSDGTLSPFGGYKDKADKDESIVTATRELWEESNGVFGDRDAICNNLLDRNIKPIENKECQHICYVAPFNITCDIMKAFKDKGYNNEIAAIVAVPRETLLNAVDTKNWNIQDRKIRPYARSVLLQARRENKL